MRVEFLLPQGKKKTFGLLITPELGSGNAIGLREINENFCGNYLMQMRNIYIWFSFMDNYLNHPNCAVVLHHKKVY